MITRINRKLQKLGETPSRKGLKRKRNRTIIEEICGNQPTNPVRSITYCYI